MKKFLSLLLAIILVAMPFSVATYAVEADEDSVVSPRYTYINSISAGISKGTLGFVNCTSDFITYETNKTCVLTCYLQRTDGNSGWVNYKSKSETCTGMGYFDIEKSWFAPSGYAYRVYTKLQVKNSAGTVVETATKVSAVYYNW